MTDMMVFLTTRSRYDCAKFGSVFLLSCEDLSSSRSSKSKYLQLSTRPLIYRYVQRFRVFVAKEFRRDLGVHDESQQLVSVFLRCVIWDPVFSSCCAYYVRVQTNSIRSPRASMCQPFKRPHRLHPFPQSIHVPTMLTSRQTPSGLREHPCANHVYVLADSIRPHRASMCQPC